MLREAGQPTGIPIQLTKNWHTYNTTDPSAFNYLPENSPFKTQDGTWYRGYLTLELAAGEKKIYEYTQCHAQWGGAPAASHSQLCLAGWGGNYQQWETSAIGSYGESFCYDAETAHKRAFIDDIRPLYVKSMRRSQVGYFGAASLGEDADRYDWTACNGGGNALFYVDENGQRQLPVNMKTFFKQQGPLLTEVCYNGVTADGRIAFSFIAQLSRTDDASRALHKFTYRFLQETPFTRLAFYQMGADNYNDNFYAQIAAGNADGPLPFKLGNKIFSGLADNPVGEGEGYPGGEQRTPLPGKTPWLAHLGGKRLPHKEGPAADRLLLIHFYSQTVNGETSHTPSFSVRATRDGLFPCTQFEISPDSGMGNCIPAGSIVEGLVEFINLPLCRSDYYGTNAYLQNMPPEAFGTPALCLAYANNAAAKFTVHTGLLTQELPARILAERGAEFTVEKGIGYASVTFTGLTDVKSYHLEQQTPTGWQLFDKSVHGQDYWQALLPGGPELTYSLPVSPAAVTRYRLVKK